MTVILDPNKTVAEIVAEYPASARVFRARGIDFCCGGKVTLESSCATHGIDAKVVRSELADVLEADATRREESDVRMLSTRALIERIVTVHHTYTRRVLPHLIAMSDKVARVHGDRNGSLPVLRESVHGLNDVLIPHLDDEERVLFPTLLSSSAATGSVPRLLDEMEAEHADVGERLRTLHRLADGFEPPNWACATYRTFFAELASLEDDLLRHIHLENHVLAARFRE